MYDYYWGLTVAQIELLSIDAPMVVYKHERKRDKNGRIIPKKASAVEVMQATTAYKEKYKNKENKHTLDLSGLVKQ